MGFRKLALAAALAASAPMTWSTTSGEPTGVWEAALEGPALRFVVGELARGVGNARTVSPFEAVALP